jgi:hypothetical protein
LHLEAALLVERLQLAVLGAAGGERGDLVDRHDGAPLRSLAREEAREGANRVTNAGVMGSSPAGQPRSRSVQSMSRPKLRAARVNGSSVQNA